MNGTRRTRMLPCGFTRWWPIWSVVAMLAACTESNSPTAHSNRFRPSFSSQYWPNEPAGATVLTDQPWDARDALGWFYDSTSIGVPQIVDDPTGPLSPPHSLQFTYNVGHPGGYAPGDERYPFAATRRVYVVQWWLDGTLVGNYSNVLFPATPLTSLEIWPGWDGSGQKTETDYYRFDHTHISANWTGSGGGRVLFQEAFEDDAFATRGWYDNETLPTDPSQHVSGSTRSLQIHFGAGVVDPWSAARHKFDATATVYVSYWVKYSDNWIGSGQIEQPHEF